MVNRITIRFGGIGTQLEQLLPGREVTSLRDIFRTVLLTLLMLVPAFAYADREAGPISYATASPDGKYLFVMLAPGETQADKIPVVDSGGRISKYIASKYPVSGMYQNDGSTTPLWTVEWYAFSVIVPSDGIHIIKRGPWAKRLSDEALTFLAQGKTLHSYKISDFVDMAAPLPHTVSHFRWLESAKLNDHDHTLEIATFSKERYSLDYTTGEVVSSRRPLRALFIVAAAITIFMAAWFIRQRKIVARTAG